MSSANIRLAARGEQDLWLTGTPKQTYFLALYKQRQPYVLESFEVPFDTSVVPYGSTATCTIPAKGDLIRTVTLKCSLPALFYQKTGWCYPVSSTSFQPYIYLFDSSNNIIELLQVRSSQVYYSAAVRTWVPYSTNLTSVTYDGTRLTYTTSATVTRIGFKNTDAPFFGFDPNTGTKFGLTGIVTYAASTSGLAAPFTLQQSGWVAGFVPPSGLNYVDSVGTYLIKTAELWIGGQTIDVVTGEYIDIRQDLEVQYENQQALLLLNGKGDTSTIQIPRTYYINLPFTPEMDIPIRKLYRHDVKVNVTFEQFSRLTSTDVPLVGYGFSNAASCSIITVQNPTLFSNAAVYDGSYISVFSYNTVTFFNPRASITFSGFVNVGDAGVNSITEAAFVINGTIYAVTTDQYIVSFPVYTGSSFLTTSYTVFPVGLTRRAACTDGRYIYVYAGLNDSTQAKNTVYKFDTQSLTLETIDLKSTGVVAFNLNLQCTPCFDGRYVYFTDKSTSQTILRYDTTGAFTTTGSWSVISYPGTQQNFLATVFDGTYLYWITDTNTAGTPNWLRYQASASFVAGSFTQFTITGVTGVTSTAQFRSPVFDGQYVYVTSGTLVLRYNTLLSFTASASYDWFNYTNGATSAGPATAIQIGGTNTFNVNLFDGRYIFSLPLGTSNVLRQDTSTVIAPTSLQTSVIVEYVSTPENNTTSEEHVITQTSLVQSPDTSFKLEVQAPVKEMFIANQTPASASGPYAYNALTNVELRFNDEKTFDWTTRTIEPLLFHSTMPQRSVELVSFSQEPESNKKLAGSVNFARIRDIQCIVPNQGANTFTRVYTRSYNVFRVENGMGGLKFMSPPFKTMYQPNNRWTYTANTVYTISTTLPLSGNALSGTQIGSIGAQTGSTSVSASQQKILTDVNGNLFLSTTYRGATVQFGQGGTQPWFGGTPESLIAMYDSSGYFVNDAVVTGLSGVNSTITGMAVQGTSLYICGYYSGGTTTVYDPFKRSSQTLPAPTTAGFNAFFAKFSIITSLGPYLLWASYATSTNTGATIQAVSISADSEGCYVSGSFTGTGATVVTFYNADVTNTSNQTIATIKGTTDAFLVKFTPIGTPSWVVSIGTSGAAVTTGSGVASSTDASVIVAGSYTGATLSVFNSAGATLATMTGNAGTDAYVLKMTTAGAFTWITRAGGGGASTTVSVAVALDQSIHITGSMLGTGSPFTMYNQPGTAGTVATGTFTNQSAYVAKWNSAGTAQWVNVLTGTTAGNYGAGITTDAFSNVFVTGLMKNGTVIGSKTYTVQGQDGFIVKYTSAGTYVWSSQIQETANDNKTLGTSVFYDRRSGALWSAGTFALNTYFNNFSGSGYQVFTARGTYDTFIVKYSA